MWNWDHALQALNDYWVTALPEVKWANYCRDYLHSNSTRSCSVQKSLLQDFSAAKSLITSSKSTERINSDSMHISDNALSLARPIDARRWFLILANVENDLSPSQLVTGSVRYSLSANPTLGNVDSKISPCALNSPFICATLVTVSPSLIRDMNCRISLKTLRSQQDKWSPIWKHISSRHHSCVIDLNCVKKLKFVHTRVCFHSFIQLNREWVKQNVERWYPKLDLMSLSASGEQHSHRIRSRESQVNSAWTDKIALNFFVLALGAPLHWGPWVAAPLAHWVIQNWLWSKF